MSRGLKLEYFILTDPLAIIAAALLISNLTDLQNHRWTYPLGAALIVAQIAVSQAEPVKHLFKHGGQQALCDPLASKAYYRRLGHFPFCGP